MEPLTSATIKAKTTKKEKLEPGIGCVVLTSSNAVGRDRTRQRTLLLHVHSFNSALTYYLVYTSDIQYNTNKLSETISDLDIDVNYINKSETITDQLPHDINIDKTLTSQQLLSPHSLSLKPSMTEYYTLPTINHPMLHLLHRKGRRARGSIFLDLNT